ncbi:MAG TPA: histidinol-phosphate transaminase [Steroidobacteraceae bacterium]|jgi:histidinol-phosphate aminotransferase
MELSRRDLLTASAILLMRPTSSISAPQAARLAATPLAGGAEPLVLLCWNENPYGPSPAARAAIIQSIADGCRYPDDENPRLVKLIAEKEGLGPDHIVTGTGSGELLRALGMLAAREHGEIVAAEPTYTELTTYAEHTGATLKLVPVDKQLRHDLSAMHAAVSAKTRAVYICNPNNPTGTMVDAAAIAAFVAALPDHVTTIIDEAYLEFVEGASSSASLVTGPKRVVVLRTFSKLHGMAGLRYGYGIARPEVIEEISAARMTTPNIFAVRAASASLGDKAFLTDCRRRIVASRARLTAELAALHLPYAEPYGNFVFFDTGAPIKQFTEFMRRRNIAVGRRFPPYENWCRVTIGTDPQISALIDGVRAFAHAV